MKRYHGSPYDRKEIKAGECATPDIDYAAKYAKGEIGGSKGFRRGWGWIYVLEVSQGQIEGEKLLCDVIPVEKIKVGDHKADSIESLLYGKEDEKPEPNQSPDPTRTGRRRFRHACPRVGQL